MTITWLAALAAAQTLNLTPVQAPLEDPEANLVEEVFVVAKTPGPAWWQVSDGDTKVWVLALPDGRLPPGLTWDHAALERRLKGANTFIGGVGVTARARDLPALLKIAKQLRSKTPLEETLPDDLRNRFVVDREKLGRPASRYAKWTPFIAGQIIVGDSRDGWTSPAGEIRDKAKAAKVTFARTMRHDAMPLVKEALSKLTPAVQQQCLQTALDDAEAIERARSAAEGWAVGNVNKALSGPRGADRCFLLMTGGAAFWRMATREQVDDISQALKQPGHAVALVSMRRLLAEDGVLAQLKARGLTVTGPSEVAP